jgi:hypothetical protein
MARYNVEVPGGPGEEVKMTEVKNFDDTSEMLAKNESAKKSRAEQNTIRKVMKSVGEIKKELLDDKESSEKLLDFYEEEDRRAADIKTAREITGRNEEAQKPLNETAAGKAKRRERIAEISELSEKVVEKNKADAEKPVDLDLRETRREAMAQAVEALENGTNVWRKRPDGSVQKAMVLRANNGNIEIGYREAGRLNVEKLTPEAYASMQEVSLDKQLEGPDAEERGEEIIFTGLETLRESAPKVFDAVNKSKWLLASRAGRFLTQGLGSIEMLGEMVSEKGSAFWGAPREIVKNIKESKAIESEEEQRKLRAATMDFDTATREQEDMMESSAVTAVKETEQSMLEKTGGLFKAAFSAMSEAGSYISKDIMRETLLGDMELITAIQEKLENPRNSVSEAAEMLTEKAVDAILEAKNVAADAYESITREKYSFDKAVGEANDKLYESIKEARDKGLDKKLKELDQRIAALSKITQTTNGVEGTKSANVKSAEMAMKKLQKEKEGLMRIKESYAEREFYGELNDVKEELAAGDTFDRKAA